MKREEMIQYAHVFLEASDQDERQLVSKLLQKGVELGTAERLVAFLPIAFGRVILKALAPMEVSNFFIVKETGKQYPLKGESIFNDAECLARDSYRTQVLSKELFSAIALRSVELRSANQALLAGDTLGNAIVAPVVLWGYKTIGNRRTLSRLFPKR